MAASALKSVIFHRERVRNRMDHRFSETASVDGCRWSVVVFTLLACLVIAGCAQRDRSSDEDKRPGGGFYGGVSGGM
jgi:hypothetical protein